MTEIHYRSTQTHKAFLLGTKGLVYLLLGLFCGFFIYCVSQRLGYPFELEWLEGEMLCHAIRLLEGQRVYAPPATEFIAEIYPPVYYLVVAALCKILGVGFVTPRIVSVAACLGILVVLYRIGVKESGRQSIGLITGGFFLSFYHIHGSWYDIGRLDMLLFFLLLCGCFLLAYYNRQVWSWPCALLLLSLACYTKQSALIYLPFIGLYLFLVDKKKAVIFMGSLGLVLAVVFAGANMFSDGWFAVYTILNPFRYSERLSDPSVQLYVDMFADMERMLLYEIRYEIFYKLPIFFTIITAFLIARVVSVKKISTVSLWEFTAIPAAIAYFMIRPHAGSEKNDFIYLTLWGCIILGLLLKRLAQDTTSDKKNILQITAYGLLGVQLLLQLYNPKELVPLPGSVEKGRELITKMRNLPGEVYFPYHSMYGVMAGKQMIFNAGAFWGYQITSADGWQPADLIEKINRKFFSAIIVDEKVFFTHLGQKNEFDVIQSLVSAGEPLSRTIADNYQPGEKIVYRNENEFRNVTGFMTRPDLILIPKEP